ncbi:MAG: glycoside hydrolase family 9 protein [Adhaeribacter sp.]
MNTRKWIGAGLLVAGLCLGSANMQVQAQSPTENIRLNQVGFYPLGPKVAVVVGKVPAGTFYLKTEPGRKTVFTGTLSAEQLNEFSKKPTRVADFSKFQKEGSYVLEVPSLGYSFAFEIGKDVHRQVAAAAIKGFYYQRMGTDLPERYAGKWHRPAGHADGKALIHPSAASAGRPAGTPLFSARGWLDAGDYNKYIVNSGITVGTLLSAYEDFPAYFKSQQLHIPESSNQVPDLLDEVLWNLRWMLTMQDPGDGGVYHKLTNDRFDGMIMPHQANGPRYVVQKSTAAALNFAAVMAQASRVYKAYNPIFPGLADSCLTAAGKAWEWARQHPDVVYDQEALNKQFQPPVTTGAYGDRNLADEFIWAAAELYLTTGQDQYYKAVNLFPDEQQLLPTWNQVRLLGYYSLARLEKQAGAAAKKDLPEVKRRLIAFADGLLAGAGTRSYRTVMGRSASEFNWGSSSNAANQGIALIQAFQLSKDKKYLAGALSNLDYLLGRNATGYCLLTGFGDKPVRNPHHRPSVADGVADPVPGLLSGGPNARAPQQDKCPGYASASPDETFLDEACSYASNEIAINWNAPLVYLSSALEALQPSLGQTSK